MKSDKELYRQLRELSCDQLWKEEAPRFDRATPKERMERVALLRAIGVVFSAAGSAQQRTEVRAWLRKLLEDPSEKIRRYAMAALPKIGAGRGDEGALLTLLEKPAGEREKKHLGRALGKIGGAATLEAVARRPGYLPQAEQKVRASLARQEQPSTIRLDTVLTRCPGLKIQLRCRRGLEAIVRGEAEELARRTGKFQVLETHSGVVTIAPTAPFSLGDLYAMRCFAHVAFLLGFARDASPEETAGTVAGLIASPLTRTLLATFTAGSLRYRLDFIGHGHRRGALHDIVNRAFALCPDLLNDARRAPWSVDIHPVGRGCLVELRPRFAPDPRLSYRKDDVDAASHPPLAACMARLAGPFENETVWDPFCGSGLELVERALLGGVRKLYGTDLSAEAIAIAKTNVAAAGLKGVETDFACCDFREFARTRKPGSLSLIVTNPPMGRRLRIPNLPGLISDLFAAAATMLKPGGRLIFPNPLKIEPRDPSLKLLSRQTVDLGGFDCRLEVYGKLPGSPAPTSQERDRTPRSSARTSPRERSAGHSAPSRT